MNSKRRGDFVKNKSERYNQVYNVRYFMSLKDFAFKVWVFNTVMYNQERHLQAKYILTFGLPFIVFFSGWFRWTLLSGELTAEDLGGLPLYVALITSWLAYIITYLFDLSHRKRYNTESGIIFKKYYGTVNTAFAICSTVIYILLSVPMYYALRVGEFDMNQLELAGMTSLFVAYPAVSIPLSWFVSGGRKECNRDKKVSSH